MRRVEYRRNVRWYETNCELARTIEVKIGDTVIDKNAREGITKEMWHGNVFLEYEGCTESIPCTFQSAKPDYIIEQARLIFSNKPTVIQGISTGNIPDSFYEQSLFESGIGDMDTIYLS